MLLSGAPGRWQWRQRPAAQGRHNGQLSPLQHGVRMRCSTRAGQIVCRNTVAQPSAACPSIPSAAPRSPRRPDAYINNQNGPGGTTIGPTAVETLRQEAFSFSVNGSPIDDWAGPVAVAAGYEYREEHYSQRGDPYAAGISASTPATVNEPCTDPFIDCGLTSLGSLGAYSAGNYHNGRGTYHVNEVFVELGVPLLND